MAGIYPDAQGEPTDPLLARISEDLPGFASAAGFASLRGSNTILRGGFMDGTRKTDAVRQKLGMTGRGEKFRIFQGDELSKANKRQFVGGGKRFSPFKNRAVAKAQAGNSQFLLKSSRVNFATARPRALTRFHSLSVFGQNAGYTPFGGAGFIGKAKPVRSAFEKAGITAGDKESLLGPGTLSFISAGRKADMLEKKAIGGSSRAAAKLAKAQTQINRLASMNNPALLETISPVQIAKNMGGRVGMSGIPAKDRLAAARAAGPTNFIKNAQAGGPVRGVSGNLMASSMAGEGSRYLAGYFRGAQGFADVAGLEGRALKGAQLAKTHMAEALHSAGIVNKGGAARMATEALGEKGVFKTLGKEGVLKALGTKSGAKVLGARALGMAIPGVNVVMAASMLYDLGKMAGDVVKSGINLAKDAVVSMKGDIAKPMFGMGYRDTEAAATSRSRGVMAIQNSQLNARSALGNEGAMMAAHFG